MSRVADTSFLIAAFDLDDKRRQEALRWLRDPEAIIIVPEVLGETLGVTHRRAGYASAIDLWQHLLSLPQVEILETTEVEAIADAFKRGRGKLSWVDAAVVAACATWGARPLCDDKEILRELGS
ncbi:MAG TPA: PIN domain-containing protein [Candidatus Thermoplasmatota archaeon]|nr:PIN domain-containing protein [Candidatus Thermoplasmatota archaeon]